MKAAQRDQAIGEARKWKSRTDEQRASLERLGELEATVGLLRASNSRAHATLDLRWMFRGVMFLAGGSTAAAVGCGLLDCPASVTASTGAFAAVLLLFVVFSDLALSPD